MRVCSQSHRLTMCSCTPAVASHCHCSWIDVPLQGCLKYKSISSSQTVGELSQQHVISVGSFFFLKNIHCAQKNAAKDRKKKSPKNHYREKSHTGGRWIAMLVEKSEINQDVDLINTWQHWGCTPECFAAPNEAKMSLLTNLFALSIPHQ